MILEQVDKLLGADAGRQPNATVGIAGFEFFARVKEGLSLRADVPDNYLEDGSVVNHHRIKQPVLVKIQGCVGDVYKTPSPLLESIRELEAQVGNITQYLPSRTQTQLSRVAAVALTGIDQVRKIDAMIATGQQLFGFLFNRDSSDTPLALQFLTFIQKLHDADAVFDVEVFSFEGIPNVYTNVVITNFEPERDATTNAINFTIELKQVRFAKTVFTRMANAADGLGGQADSPVENGVQARHANESEAHYLARINHLDVQTVGAKLSNFLTGSLK